MTEEDLCSRCGKEIGGIILFDSSTSDGMFCEECHREDMKQMYEKRRNKNNV